MWVLKGTLLALWLAGFGTMAWLYLSIYRHLPIDTAVGVSAITAYTTRNLLWWAGILACLIIGYRVARSWTGPVVFWIALLVTGLVPAGILTLFAVLFFKFKQATQGLL